MALDGLDFTRRRLTAICSYFPSSNDKLAAIYRKRIFYLAIDYFVIVDRWLMGVKPICYEWRMYVGGSNIGRRLLGLSVNIVGKLQWEVCQYYCLSVPHPHSPLRPLLSVWMSHSLGGWLAEWLSVWLTG